MRRSATGAGGGPATGVPFTGVPFTGTMPATRVPSPGVDSIVTSPPSAARRSRMLVRPAPGVTGSLKPAPSSRTSKRKLPVSDNEIQTPVAPWPCLTAFCSASTHA